MTNWIIWLAMLVGAFAGGWTANGWRLDAEIAGMKQEAADMQLKIESHAEVARLASQHQVTKVEKVFVEKANNSRRATQSNLPKVDQYASPTFPPLPGAFRVWHDAAAAAEELADPPGADAPPVSLREAETVIAKNYASCNYDKQRLEALQEIVRTLAKE
jgi:hypothetical protein